MRLALFLLLYFAAIVTLITLFPKAVAAMIVASGLTVAIMAFYRWLV